MLDVYSYKRSSTKIRSKNIFSSGCQLNSTVNISCQIWTASFMTKTSVLWQKLHTKLVFIMSNYYGNLSLIKSIDQNNFLWLKLKSVCDDLSKQFYWYKFFERLSFRMLCFTKMTTKLPYNEGGGLEQVPDGALVGVQGGKAPKEF